MKEHKGYISKNPLKTELTLNKESMKVPYLVTDENGEQWEVFTIVPPGSILVIEDNTDDL